MGLGDFLGKALGSKNKFNVSPLALDEQNYNEAIRQSQAAALGSINSGAAAGQRQMSLADQLAAQANGQGPSLAQMQLQQASDQNLKNSAALIASQRGINPAQAARQVAMQNASQGQALASQAGQLRLQEQLQKQNLLANTLQAQRGQDISQQGANANLYGLTGQLANQQNQTKLQNYYGAQNINAGVAAGNTATNNALMGQLISAGAAAGAGALGASSGGVADGGFGYDFFEMKKFSKGGMLDDGKVRVAVSPGEKIVTPGGEVHEVPGEEVVKGDHPDNDTVVADLKKDSIVIPKSKANDKDKMLEFMKHMKKTSAKKSELQSILDSHQELKQSLDEIKAKLGKWSTG